MTTPGRRILAALLLCPAPLAAQEPELVVVRAARMLDVSTGRMVSPAFTVTDAGR